MQRSPLRRSVPRFLGIRLAGETLLRGESATHFFGHPLSPSSPTQRGHQPGRFRVSRDDLEGLVTSSEVVLERERHRLLHESDWQRWVPGLVEVLREKGIDAVRYVLWDATGWHRYYSPPAWRNRATEEQKRIGWEMAEER